MDHHEFSPSRLEQYRLCPGSYWMQKGIPESESEIAKEGQLLHNAVATGDLKGLDDEQTKAVQKCQAFIDSVWSEGAELFTEKKVAVYDPETKEIITFGTADVVISNGAAISVIDWKFGYNPVKNVNENIQLAAYAAGAMQLFGLESCACFVFQPRIGNKSHHGFTNLSAIIANIKSIIKRAKSDRLVLNATEDSCRYCLARLNCPAFRLKFQRLAACKRDYDLSNIDTLVKLYDASRGVSAIIREIESEVKKVIEDKGSCGPYRFEISEGSRQIKDLNSLYAMLKEFVTPNEFNNVCSVTLGKLEKLMSEKLVADAKAHGETLSKVAASERFYGMVGGLISRGSPSKKIVGEAQV